MRGKSEPNLHPALTGREPSGDPTSVEFVNLFATAVNDF